MNIAFFYDKGTLPVIGGVASISYSLGILFRRKGYNVFFIGIKDVDHLKYDRNQVFLPNDDLDADSNVLFLAEYLISNNIKLIINQNGSYDISYITFLNKVKSKMKGELRIVTCFHTSIYTNVLNIAYEKEIELKKKHLGVIFQILRQKPVYKILLWLFIRKHRLQYRENVKLSDLSVVLCPGQEYELRKMTGLYSTKTIKVINNTLAVPESGKREQDKENIVLWVGAFSGSIKRPDFMLRIWSILQSDFPSWKLILLGDGGFLEEAKRLSFSLNLQNVEFKGRTDSKPYFEKAKILCMTSTHEAFPMVLLEAMNTNTVPFAFNSFTSAAYIINDGHNGILVKPFNIGEYATKLSSIMKSERKRQRLSEAAYKTMEFFSAEKVLSAWECCFKELLEN